MGNFDRKYTDDQRDAVAHAYEDRKIRPASRVADLAARGALEWKGEALDPFQMPVDTIREQAKTLRRKRAGLHTSELSKVDHRDAIDVLRQRLVSAADALLADYEKQLRKDPAKADPARLREIMRATREAAALPGRNDARPVKPGAKENGVRNGGATVGGLAGSIIHAARGETVPNDPHPVQAQGHSNTHEPERSGAAAHTQPAHDAHSAAAQPGSQPSDHGTAFSMA